MRYFFVLFLLFSSIASAGEGELLEPEQAFRFSAHAVDGQTLEVHYQIAEGYYLYKVKLRFQAEPSDVILGTPQLPAGRFKQDEYFGKEEIYRHDLVIRLPYTRSTASRVILKSVSQGCADAGVCYPPQTQEVKIDLPVAQANTEKKSSLLQMLGGGQDGFLSADQAFRLVVKVIDKETLLANFTIAENYYLYRNKIKFSLKGGGVDIKEVVLPQGEIKTDPNFGNTEVYHHPFQALVKLRRDGGSGQPTSLTASYQGCSEKGICYPPVQETLVLTLPATAVKPIEAVHQSTEVPEAEMTVASHPVGAQGSDSSRIGALFKDGSFWLIMGSFFGFGLLLSLTPCVLPMIPILSGIIVGQGHALTRFRAVGLSLVYVLGMALTYAVAGVAAGMSGTLLSSTLQNPWVLGGFALIFVVLAFSMFGFYELQMPSFIQSRFNDASNRVKGGSMVGVFTMGALSAVIMGPCVAAPLAGALLYIGQTHDMVLGGSALFFMALGMGSPLLLVGASAGALLPRAGGWMGAVKSFFGVLLLGMAIWLISPVISPVVHMLLWAVLLIVSSIYLRAIDPLPHPARGFAKFWKGVGVVALMIGVALLIGALSGNRDMLQPLSGLRVAEKVTESLKFERVKNVAELESRLQQATGKPVILDFYADWCVSCKEFERFTLADAEVQAKLRGIVLLQADVTSNSKDDDALRKKFGIVGPPSIIFFDKNGKEVNDTRVIGYEPPKKFIATLDAIIP